MFSPFLIRNVVVVLLLTANLCLAAWWVRATGRHFDRERLVPSISMRALSIGYVGAAVLMLAGALTFFVDFELSPDASRAWRVGRQWGNVKVGMAKEDLISLLGEPTEMRFELLCYRDRPLDNSPSTAEMLRCVEIKDGRVSEILPNPVPPDWRIDRIASYILSGSSWSSILWPLIILIASLIPISLTSGWAATPLYYPLLILIPFVIFIQGLVSASTGWRFDLFLWVPTYTVIGITWIIRVILVARRS